MLFASAAVAKPPPPGVYRVAEGPDVAGGIELTKDGRFSYFLAAGALDEQANGRWEVRGEQLCLTTEPTPVAPTFALGPRRSDVPDSPTLLVTWPNGRGIAGVDFQLGFATGEPAADYTQEYGWTLPEEETRKPVWIEVVEPIHGVVSSRFTLNPAVRGTIMVVLTPNDIGMVDFRERLPRKVGKDYRPAPRGWRHAAGQGKTLTSTGRSGNRNRRVTMRHALALTASILGLAACAQAQATTIAVIKDPDCGCCTEWVAHLRHAGFVVEVTDTREQPAISAKLGVPRAIARMPFGDGRRLCDRRPRSRRRHHPPAGGEARSSGAGGAGNADGLAGHGAGRDEAAVCHGAVRRWRGARFSRGTDPNKRGRTASQGSPAMRPGGDAYVVIVISVHWALSRNVRYFSYPATAASPCSFENPASTSLSIAWSRALSGASAATLV